MAWSDRRALRSTRGSASPRCGPVIFRSRTGSGRNTSGLAPVHHSHRTSVYHARAHAAGLPPCCTACRSARPVCAGRPQPAVDSHACGLRCMLSTLLDAPPGVAGSTRNFRIAVRRSRDVGRIGQPYAIRGDEAHNDVETRQHTPRPWSVEYMAPAAIHRRDVRVSSVFRSISRSPTIGTQVSVST